jgi:NADPH:quinone reductase-like Zn-dependent oxidoreductase
VIDIEPGELVWTSSAGYGGRAGATADLVPVERDRLYRLPDGADPVGFVAAVHPATTAYGVLVRAGLRPGETLAVVGANGAVGMCLVQVAAALGARVVAVVRDPRSERLVRDLGATEVVVSDAALERLRSEVEVFVDTSGRADLARVPEHLAPRGRIVVIAGRGRPAIDVWERYTREIQLLGFVMSAMTVTELAAAAEWINARHRDRPLRVGVGAVRGFDAAAEAHDAVESRRLPRLDDGSVGRFVLRPTATEG